MTIQTLPKEIVFEIFSYLEFRDLQKSKAVSKAFKVFSNQIVLQRFFPVSDSSQKEMRQELLKRLESTYYRNTLAEQKDLKSIRQLATREDSLWKEIKKVTSWGRFPANFPDEYARLGYAQVQLPYGIKGQILCKREQDGEVRLLFKFPPEV